MTANDLVTIATFQFLPAAEAARLRLEQEDIPVFLADANMVAMDWFMGNAVGYIKLQVSQDQAVKARELVDQMETQQRQQADDSAATGADLCLACGAELAANSDKCSNCGWTYV